MLAKQGTLQQDACTLIELQGDYLDTRIGNTEQELSAYEADPYSPLDPALDEYGLVVCGWSATWDFRRMREPLRHVVRSQFDYERTFDRCEYIVALLRARRRVNTASVQVPFGMRASDLVGAARTATRAMW